VADKKKNPRQSAFDSALRILSLRDHGRVELRRKLSERGFEAEEIRQSLTRLEDLSYLDDRRFSEAMIRSWVERKGHGFTSARSKLLKAGVDEVLIAEVMEESGDSINERKICLREAARKKSKLRGEARKRRDKLLRFLAGRGFPASIVYDVVEKVMSEDKDEDEQP